jgi:glyoxalase family protein
MELKGLHHLTAVTGDPSANVGFYTEVLGLRLELVDDGGRPGGPGTEVHLDERPDLFYGRVGIGGVHHVAFRTPDGSEQAPWRRRLLEAGIGVTPVIDHFYFQSIYFRGPEGVVFEIATEGPGFTADEPKERLGQALALPPFLESQRARIEAGLRPIRPASLVPSGR